MNEPKKVILVTGSSGYLGYPIAERLAASYSVVGFDRRQPSHPPPGAECVYVDLTSEPSLRRGLETIREMHGNRLACVIHLAAYYDFSGAVSPLYEKVTVRGTERLLRLLREMFTVEQFIFSSTMLVHAPAPPGRAISEDSPLDPTWAYPQSKVETEKVIHAERGDIPAVILRIAGVYDDLGHSMPLPRQMQRIFEHDLTASVFPGNLDHGQAMVHRDDVVDLYSLLVASREKLPPELTLLVAEPETLSYGEMQQTLGDLIHGEKWKTRRIPKPLAKIGAWAQQILPLGVTPFFKAWMIDRADDHFELDISRARKAAGWEPKRSLRETLPSVVAALKADPWAWYRENDLEMPQWLREIEPRPPKEGIKTPAHGGMPMAEPEAPPPEVKRLQQLRLVQATLKPVFEEELASQRKHDAEAQGLMDTDPKGHIEMMRMPQEHAALVRELPAQILREEAKLYTSLAPALEADRAKSRPEPGVVMAGHIGMERWTQAALLSLGAWLAASPFALGYRSAALTWNDVASGLLVIALAAFALSGRRWAPWASCGVGLWVMFAPLAFWAPDAAAYANETLLGALIVTFSILVPMRMKMDGSDVPVGWTYSPSSWLQRAPIIALGFLAFYLSRYMAAFQLGHIQSAWDPLFGDGTRRVLTSDVSRAFPISDAGLGAYAYMIEILSGFMGDARRWRTMPWMVALFGIAVVPLGIISTVLIVLQPLAVGAWCTLCLTSAGLMLIMVALSLDEIVAMIQFLIQSKREGRSAWRTFWVGGNAPVGLRDDILLSRPEGGVWRQMVWGTTVPWNLLFVSLVGIWLMMSPAAFKSASPAAHADHLLGALVVVVAAIAMAEVGRAARFLNILLALGIIAAPWVLTGASPLARWNDLAAGLIVIGLSVRRGPIRERYGTWNRYIA